MPALRVLLLEDDPAVRLFVQMALEPLPVDLVACATLAQARQALADPAIRMVLTDLTLPDGSGLDLLQWLEQRARSGGVRCRTVVFSGGIDTAMGQKLQALQVWRVLHKPASVGSLMACVSDALDADATAAQATPPVSQTDPVVEFFG
ncbi:MAG: response regulator [Giesbergeria sp.]|jgi:DNA-binding NtrC family response regulator|nr:response regulator [Giesbergeria sp.]